MKERDASQLSQQNLVRGERRNCLNTDTLESIFFQELQLPNTFVAFATSSSVVTEHLTLSGSSPSVTQCITVYIELVVPFHSSETRASLSNFVII